MQPERITKSMIENCLRALRGGNKPDSSLAELAFLRESQPASAQAIELRFQDLLAEWSESAYTGQRTAEGLSPGLPETRARLRQQVREDFSRGNSELEAWSALYARYLALVPFSVEELAQAASVAPQQLRRRLNQATHSLVQKARRLEMEAQRRSRQTASFLPLPDTTRLLAVQPYFELLAELLHSEEGPRLVSLEGIGGIGKTATARGFAAQEQAAAHWERILWVSARPGQPGESGDMPGVDLAAVTLEDVTDRLARQLELEHLAGRTVEEKIEGLRAVLEREHDLVVVDNLETVWDYSALVPALARCAGNSRFLITTRQTLRNFLYVHTIRLSELEPASARELVQSEIQRRGQEVSISEQDFDPLYRLTGGLPLALKLAAAQMGFHSLKDILANLRGAREGVEELYRFLYWRAWQLLGDPARRLMLAFLAVDPEGEDADFLQMASGQPDEVFYPALMELSQFSLLETNGDARLPRYRLHRLTITFLQTDLLKLWDEKETHE